MLRLSTKNWFTHQKKINNLSVKIVDLSKLKDWVLGKKLIYHKSKKFFKIVGIKVFTNFYKKNWDQPIIIQKEVGILGIIKNEIKNEYLLQAKVEPGNKNKLQLSPTVQATKSNYTRIHGGKNVPYLNHFLKKKHYFSINQSEQGFRYLHKFNSNILIKIKKNIKKKNNFFWFSAKEITYLVRRKNILNMDTLSVFSSFIKKLKKDFPTNSNKKLNKWIKTNERKYFIKTKIVSLASLTTWIINKKNITHILNKHFSIVGANIAANKREVLKWNQPLIKGKKLAFAGFIMKKFNNTNHYLCRFLLKPGLKNSAISCSVNTSDIYNLKKNSILTTFQKKLINGYFFNKKKKKQIIYKNIISDEGGRFLNCQIKCMGLLLKDDFLLKIPPNYFWISQNQMINLIKHKKIDIESRLLFACINIKNIN